MDLQRREQLVALLGELKEEMVRLEIWSGQAPDARMLESTLPFCADRMGLHQWLEWVFLPRMQAILDAESHLPGSCGIAPLAELEYAGKPQFDGLIRLLAQLDIYINS